MDQSRTQKLPHLAPGSRREDPNAFVFGIDFGTTYTGCAYAWSGQPDEIHLVTGWESELYGNAEREKAPTAIHYGQSGEMTWGYGVPLDVEPIQWFKLLLLRREDLQTHPREAPGLICAREMVRRLGKRAVDLVADYLRLLWGHVVKSVTRRFGKTMVGQTPFHVVVTVPAIWKSYARERMRKAVTKAGILDPRACGQTTLDFVSEPEAAALATLSDLKGRPDVKPGDAITVVDAGGGTVDIISYQITRTDPVSMREAVEGQGALCGGIFLDQEFTNMIRRLIGDQAWSKIPRGEIKKMVDQSWEHGIKQQFDGKRRSWTVDLPPACAEMTKRQSIELQCENITEIFKNVVKRIEVLVGQQTAKVGEKTGKPSKYVILVGGFGRCKYLYERLNRLLEGASEVLQASGSAPWTAICRGAVIRAMGEKSTCTGIPKAVHVQTRISRSNYGLLFSAWWDEKIHDQRDKYKCPVLGEYMVSNQIQWFHRRGENTSDKSPTRLLQFQYFEEDKPDNYPNLSISLVSCDDTETPTRFDSSVKYLCEVRFKPTTPFEELPRRVNAEGKTFRVLDYDILLTTSGESVVVLVTANGVKLGARNLKIDFEGRRSSAKHVGKEREVRERSSRESIKTEPNTRRPSEGFSSLSASSSSERPRSAPSFEVALKTRQGYHRHRSQEGKDRHGNLIGICRNGRISPWSPQDSKARRGGRDLSYPTPRTSRDLPRFEMTPPPEDVR